MLAFCEGSGSSVESMALYVRPAAKTVGNFGVNAD